MLAVVVPTPMLMALSFLAGYGARILQAFLLAAWRRRDASKRQQ